MVENYIGVEYPQGVNSKYVRLLCEYLVRRYQIKPGTLMMDVGSGTGNYWRCFHEEFDINIAAYGGDLEEKWGCRPNILQYVFCKSVLEHISNTGRFLIETKRVLERNGMAIFLVPDWNSQWKYFYDDSTHIKPFTKKGLEQAFKLVGFKDVQCEYFFQLPFTWRHWWLRWIPYIVRLMPDNTRYWAKVIRFSKERMLLLTAVKK